jgi:RHS repeat-associated protein
MRLHANACTRGRGCAGSNYPFLTSKERDIETGLDYFLARYYSSTQGRFTSADEPFADQGEEDPQSWNLYLYAGNNPLLFTDPMGLWKWVDPDKNGNRFLQREKDDDWQTLATFLNNNSDDTYYREDLEKAFSGGGLGEGTIVDVTGASPRFTSSRGGVQDASWVLVPLPKAPKLVRTVLGLLRAFGSESTSTPKIPGRKIEPVQVKLTENSAGNLAPLRPLHKTLDQRILQYFRGKSTEELMEALKPGRREALRVKPDGTIMNGNHRIQVLRERGIDVNNLPRESYP